MQLVEKIFVDLFLLCYENSSITTPEIGTDNLLIHQQNFQIKKRK